LGIAEWTGQNCAGAASTGSHASRFQLRNPVETDQKTKGASACRFAIWPQVAASTQRGTAILALIEPRSDGAATRTTG